MLLFLLFRTLCAVTFTFSDPPVDECVTITAMENPDSDTSIEFPFEYNGNTVIGISQKLENAGGIVKVTISSAFKTICDDAFVNFVDLKEFSIDSKNTNFEVFDKILYTKGRSTIVCCPQSVSTRSYTQEIFTEIFAPYSFYNVKSITEVTIQYNVNLKKYSLVLPNLRKLTLTSPTLRYSNDFAVIPSSAVIYGSSNFQELFKSNKFNEVSSGTKKNNNSTSLILSIVISIVVVVIIIGIALYCRSKRNKKKEASYSYSTSSSYSNSTVEIKN